MSDLNTRLQSRDAQRRLTLGQYADLWIARIDRGTLKPGAKKSYRLQLDHLLPHFGALTLDYFGSDKPEDIFDFHERLESFVSGKLAMGKAPRTIRNMLQCLNKMLSDAHVRMVIDRNPMLGKIDQFSLNRPKEADSERVRAMTQEQLDQFLRAAKFQRGDIYYLWLFLARTGCRIGEALALTWDDFDLEERRVAINKSLYVEGSIANAQVLTPKTPNSNRRVPLSTGTCEAILELRAIRERQAREWGERLPRVVFCGTTGAYRGGYRNPRHMADIAATTCKLASIPAFTVHELRHSYATIRICKGHNIQEVSRALGHSSTQITLNTYAKWYFSVDRDAVESLDDTFTPATNTNFSQEYQFVTQCTQ